MKSSKDITSDTYIKGENRNSCFRNTAERPKWQDNYENLLNVEFTWLEDNLTPVDTVLRPGLLITKEDTVAALNAMKNGKVPGSSEIISEMVKASLETSSESITFLANAIIEERTNISEWNDNYIISISKRKIRTSIQGNRRGLKLSGHL